MARCGLPFLVALAAMTMLPLRAQSFGARFEPPPGQVYHGAQGEFRPLLKGLKTEIDWAGLETYAAAVGERPKLVMHYVTLQPELFAMLKPAVRSIAEQPYDYIAQIGLDFYRYEWRPRSRRFDISPAVARGEYDFVLQNLAETLRDMAIPVLLRPGFEFGAGGFGSLHKPEAFVAAFRRVVTVFREAGVTNVAFVWHTKDADNFMAFYPGDDWVDWWGISIFDADPTRDPMIGRFTETAREHRKPIIIAESTPRAYGVADARATAGGFFLPLFRYIRDNDHVKALCYLNASWEGYFDPGFRKDCRLQENPELLTIYRDVLTRGRFIHAGPRVDGAGE